MSPRLLPLVLLLACESEEPKYDGTETTVADDPAGTPTDDRAEGDGGLYEVVKVMERECTICHSDTPDEVLLEDYNEGPPPMLLTPDVFCDVVLDGTLVLPSDPDRGLLYARMTSTEQPMPPSGALGDSDIRALKEWIDAGAHCSSGEGALLFRQTCAGCHGIEGEGGTGPALASRLDGQTVATVQQTVLEGSGAMAAIELSQAEAAEVATYVIGAWGP